MVGLHLIPLNRLLRILCKATTVVTMKQMTTPDDNFSKKMYSLVPKRLQLTQDTRVGTHQVKMWFQPKKNSKFRIFILQMLLSLSLFLSLSLTHTHRHLDLDFPLPIIGHVPSLPPPPPSR